MINVSPKNGLSPIFGNGANTIKGKRLHENGNIGHKLILLIKITAGFPEDCSEAERHHFFRRCPILNPRPDPESSGKTVGGI